MINDKDIAYSHIKKALKLLETLTGYGRRSAESVFSDFLMLSVCSYSNVFDAASRAARENQYLEIVKGYNKEEVISFAEILAEIVMAAEIYLAQGYIKDILGYIYTEGQFYKKSMGQFFTPDNIAVMMSRLIASDCKELLKETEFVSVSEPTCGSGVMVLAFAENMLQDEINYQNSMLVDAWDLDKTCALMAYLQFAVYNIPARVTHGESLSLKAYSQWITPMYFINDFSGKQHRQKGISRFRKLLADSSKPTAKVADFDMQDIRTNFEAQSLFDDAM